MLSYIAEMVFDYLCLLHLIHNSFMLLVERRLRAQLLCTILDYDNIDNGPILILKCSSDILLFT